MPRVIVITGTSAGVGRATARAFTREGAHIGLIARGADALKACRREVDAAGGRALVLRADVADAAAVEAAAEAVEQQLGPIDVWVNCAMTSVFSPVKQMTADEFKRVTDVAYLGYVYSTLSALRRMLPRDRGVILQVGSALAYRCIPLQSAYCAAKHAIHGFCDSLRSELIHDRSRVRVCMLQMPALNTPQFGWVKSRLPHKAQPVPPIYQPEVAADAIVYASHHPRREFYVGWPAMQAIVGDKLIPGLLDHYLASTGFSGQQTDEPEDLDRPDNLWTPVPGDRGAHGSFDARAHAFSPLFWANRHRAWFMVAGGLAMAGAAMAFLTDREAVPSEAGQTDA